jgi:ankyrin repeat protein
MRQPTCYIYRLLLICCLLAQLVNCKQCGRNNPKESSSSTSDTNNGGGAPPPPSSPITDAMVEEVTNKKNTDLGYGWDLLEEVLENLKNGSNATINNQGVDNWTALHLAVELKNLNIVKALLDRKADVNLLSNLSYTPFHLALIIGNFNAALLLLESKKITPANLEAAVIGNPKITALAYARGEEAKGINQANWQAIIKELKAAGATK